MNNHNNIVSSSGQSTPEMLRDIRFQTEHGKLFSKQVSRLFRPGGDGQPTYEPALVTAGTETNGVIMIDASGGGKTTTIQEVLSKFDALQDNPETGRPRYLKIKVESPATQKSLGTTILEKLGVDHIAERAKVWEIWRAVRVRLDRMGITLLWIDEAQDMFKDTAATETDNMLKMLKSLMQGEHPVVLVLSGTERLGRIAGLDPQLSRRFAKIKPRDLEIGADNKDLEELVSFLSGKAGLTFNSDFDVISRLIHGSRYKFGRAIESTILAIEEALDQDSSCLAVEHFEVSWGEREICEPGRNVFAAEDWIEIELDVDEDEYEAQRTAATNKARQKAKRRKKK
ncbi:hypothetical protein AN189_06455 [Loktanella sp. 3ANDIMAR09]|uniref:ATP-binding protein n=1 Tax=Loktanella sp. 3ANDIMAR09 TaxID=1225657 RepID=UPI0007074869|nr:ATP-binding protein [Loktanella sp. 3ANDIMAR09]KQI69199.1 hypothetical protein AN189_06455 [Loktanella sp. 3ANDIMAR09]